MAYKWMQMQGFLNYIEQVTSYTNPRRFCFVLGAGASCTSGIKTGHEMVDEWEKHLKEMFGSDHEEWKLKNGITDENKYSHYSQYYDRRFESDTEDGYSYIEGIMNNAKPSAGYVVLSYLLANTPHQVVVTTNFDHLTEDAVVYYAQTIPQVIPHEALAHYIRREIYRPTIVKIHRDMLLNPKNRPAELDKLDEKWKKALSDIFSVYCPVFIGYAGNDRCLMDFLKDNSEKFRPGGEWKTPYWMLFKRDKLEGDVLSFVNAADGYVIRHEGFDETMFLIGEKLGFNMPTQEEFFEEPTKRYNALIDAINSYKKLNRMMGTGETKDDDFHKGDVAVVNDYNHSSDRKASDFDTLYIKKQYDEAFIMIKELAETEPENEAYKRNLEMAYHALNRDKELLEIRQKAVNKEPDNAKYWMDLWRTQRLMGLYREALESEKNAIEKTRNASDLDEFSRFLLSVERYDDAIKVCNKAVKLEPNNGWYWNKLGIAYQAKKKYKEAVDAFQKAVELAPEEKDYLENLNAARKMENLDS